MGFHKTTAARFVRIGSRFVRIEEDEERQFLGGKDSGIQRMRSDEAAGKPVHVALMCQTAANRLPLLGGCCSAWENSCGRQRRRR